MKAISDQSYNINYNINVSIDRSVNPHLKLYLLNLMKGTITTVPNTSIEEWDTFIHTIASSQIIPIFYKKIALLNRDQSPPPEITSMARKVFLRSRIKALILDDQLEEITTAFREKKINYMLWKGPALGRYVYEDPALRPCGDIDILIQMEDMKRTRSTLQNLGYFCKNRLFEGSIAYGNQETWIPHAEKKEFIPIELHWDIHPFTGLKDKADLNELFRKKIEVSLNGLKFYSLRPIDALITAAIHLIFGYYNDIRLIWLYDIALLTKLLSSFDDWTELQQLSIRWNARISLEIALKMAISWTDIKIPNKFRDFSKWPKPSSTEVRLFPHLLKRKESSFSRFKIYWPRHHNIRRKFEFLFRVFFPHSAYVHFKYPQTSKWKFPIAYTKCILRNTGIFH